VAGSPYDMLICATQPMRNMLLNSHYGLYASNNATDWLPLLLCLTAWPPAALQATWCPFY
jgi:hypothetical protein